MTPERSGLVLGRTEHPDVWASVYDAARIAGTRPPDEIRLVVDARVAVTEESKWLGLVAGSRRLVLGLPLLQGLDRRELLALVSHELGHFSVDADKRAPLKRRGLLALVDLVERHGGSGLAGRLLATVLRLYVRFTGAALRQQELDADVIAAHAVGAKVAAEAIRASVELAHHYEGFARDYGWVAAPTRRGPQNLFGGFATYLSQPSRTLGHGLDQVLAAEELAWWDPHLPTAERITMLERMTDAEPELPVGNGEASALTLLSDAGQVVARIEADIVRDGGLALGSWETVVRDGWRARTESRAAAVVSCAERVLGPGGANLGGVLAAIGEERPGKFVRTLLDRDLEPAAAREELVSAVEAVVAAALIDRGEASYVLRWDQPNALLDTSGQPVDVRSLVAHVPGNPAEVAFVLGVLADEGVAPTWSPRSGGEFAAR